jgi:hypothetical protein
MHDDDTEPTISKRFRMPNGYPILAAITIDPADWFRFERLNDDTPATRIVGHDGPQDGMMTVYVACASDRVRERLEDSWA